MQRPFPPRKIQGLLFNNRLFYILQPVPQTTERCSQTDPITNNNSIAIMHYKSKGDAQRHKQSLLVRWQRLRCRDGGSRTIPHEVSQIVERVINNVKLAPCGRCNVCQPIRGHALGFLSVQLSPRTVFQPLLLLLLLLLLHVLDRLRSHNRRVPPKVVPHR
jgi:hypothetical protein